MNRWFVAGVFVLSSAINYLDRQTLATLAPLIKDEFHVSNTEYGYIVSAFSVTYALAAPFAGIMIDRIGLTMGITLAVAVWSAASIATGTVHGLNGLIFCRAVLGLAEAAGIPAAGKAIYRFLRAEERALGNAVNQAGVSLGAMAAPPLTTWVAVQAAYGWRAAFQVTGLIGLLWIPLWLWTSRRSGVPDPARTVSGQPRKILRDPRMWGFVAANALSMIIYSLWTNWTTLYLVDVCGLTLPQAARFAWIPPLFATVGGVGGGALSLRWMRAGMRALEARRRVCLLSAAMALATGAVPLMPDAAWSAAGISLSICAVAAFSVNLYTMPLDAFGGSQAAFAVSMLVSAYGTSQALVSPAFGSLIDRFGYAPVCMAAALTPAAGYAALRFTRGAA